MAQLDLNNATSVGLTQVPDFIVEAKTLDSANPDSEETFVYFDKAPESFAYYLQHPQVSSPINMLATWSVSKGWTTEDVVIKKELEHVTGMGKDTFETLMWNHEAVKLIVGDSFMEVIRRKFLSNKIINMMPISPERVKVVIKGARIVRYEIWNGSKWVTKRINQILHSQNKRIGDQVHGTSLIQSNKVVIDALLEANADERVIKHRDKALGIVKYKTNNTGKIEIANAAIRKVVEDGDMLGISEDVGEILPWPSKSSEDRQNWLKYLENLNYQTGGVPRSIATSDGTTEVGGINGHLIFEPIYTKEQVDLENDLWSQHQIRIKFNRPPSLAPSVQENAEKNTGQLEIQPNEVEPKLNR